MCTDSVETIIGVLPVVKKDYPQLLSLNEDDEELVPPPLPPKSYVLD